MIACESTLLYVNEHLCIDSGQFLTIIHIIFIEKY